MFIFETKGFRITGFRRVWGPKQELTVENFGKFFGSFSYWQVRTTTRFGLQSTIMVIQLHRVVLSLCISQSLPTSRMKRKTSIYILSKIYSIVELTSIFQINMVKLFFTRLIFFMSNVAIFATEIPVYDINNPIRTFFVLCFW